MSVEENDPGAEDSSDETEKDEDVGDESDDDEVFFPLKNYLS